MLSNNGEEEKGLRPTNGSNSSTTLFDPVAYIFSRRFYLPTYTFFAKSHCPRLFVACQTLPNPPGGSPEGLSSCCFSLNCKPSTCTYVHTYRARHPEIYMVMLRRKYTRSTTAAVYLVRLVRSFTYDTHRAEKIKKVNRELPSECAIHAAPFKFGVSGISQHAARVFLSASAA